MTARSAQAADLPAPSLGPALLAYGSNRAAVALINLLTLTAHFAFLPPAGFARYALTVSLLAAANALLCQWIRHGVLRDAAGAAAPAEFGRHVGAQLAAVLVLAPAVFALARPVDAAVFPLENAVLLWALLGSQSAFELMAEHHRGRVEIACYRRLALARSLGVAALGVPASYFLASAELAIVAILVANLLAAWASGSSAARERARLRLSPGWLAEKLRYGLPIALAGALLPLVDAAIRSHLAGAGALAPLGLYALFYDAGNQASLAAAALFQGAAVPLLVRAKNAAREAARLYAMAFRAAGAVILGGIALVTVLHVAAPFVRETALAVPQAPELALPLLWSIAVLHLLAFARSAFVHLPFQVARRTAWLACATPPALLAYAALAMLYGGTSPAAFASLAFAALALACGAEVAMGWRLGFPRAWVARAGALVAALTALHVLAPGLG